MHYLTRPAKKLFAGMFLTVCLASLLLTACGEQEKVYNLGVYLPLASLSARLDGLKDGLKTLGYVEGKNIRYNLMSTEGMTTPEQVTTAFKDFAAKNYDAYWTISGVLAQAVKKAGTNQPIVTIGILDPVTTGLAESVERPGSNITGIFTLNNEQTTKRLGWMVKLNPKMQKIYLPYNSKEPTRLTYVQSLKDEAERLGVTLLERPYTTTDEFLKIIDQFKATEAQGVLTIGINPLLVAPVIKKMRSVVEREKLILPGGEQDQFQAGAIFTYGANAFAVGRQSANYVHKALTGSNPATLPLLRPGKVEFLLNQSLADQFGISFPEVMLSAADEVIK